MVEYKKCPRCGGWIPNHWSHHEKCGWNIQEIEEVERDQAVREMETAVVNSFEIWKRIKQRYPMECRQLDLTKIALTLFIEKRKGKMPTD